MGEVTQYARQAYLGTGPKGLLRATKGSKLPHPYRGITLLRIRYTPTGTYHADYRLHAPVTTNMSDA